MKQHEKINGKLASATTRGNEKKKLTQKQVSARLGIAQSTLAAWMGGRNKPGITEFEQLAAAIDEDVVWLIWEMKRENGR